MVFRIDQRSLAGAEQQRTRHHLVQEGVRPRPGAAVEAVQFTIAGEVVHIDALHQVILLEVALDHLGPLRLAGQVLPRHFAEAPDPAGQPGGVEIGPVVEPRIECERHPGRREHRLDRLEICVLCAPLPVQAVDGAVFLRQVLLPQPGRIDILVPQERHRFVGHADRPERRLRSQQWQKLPVTLPHQLLRGGAVQPHAQEAAEMDLRIGILVEKPLGQVVRRNQQIHQDAVLFRLARQSAEFPLPVVVVTVLLRVDVARPDLGLYVVNAEFPQEVEVAPHPPERAETEQIDRPLLGLSIRPDHVLHQFRAVDARIFPLFPHRNRHSGRFSGGDRLKPPGLRRGHLLDLPARRFPQFRHVVIETALKLRLKAVDQQMAHLAVGVELLLLQKRLHLFAVRVERVPGHQRQRRQRGGKQQNMFHRLSPVCQSILILVESVTEVRLPNS